MRWTVEGADKATGKDRVIQIEAGTSAEAERIASAKGLLVSGVYEPTTLTAAEQLEKMIDTSLSNSDLAAPSIPPTSPPAPIAYASGGFQGPTPSYAGLQVGGTVMFVCAAVYYAVAIFAVVGAILSLFGVVNPRTSGIAFLSAATLLFWALVAAMTGGLLHAGSAGCAALRDIARNSFAR